MVSHCKGVRVPSDSRMCSSSRAAWALSRESYEQELSKSLGLE